MKILIDARLYGLEHSGIGRYLINLIKEISKIDEENNYILLLRKKYFQVKSDRFLNKDLLKLPKNWKKVLADFRHYSFQEQIYLPKILRAENPDLVHFPHFNIPFFCKERFVVTIHDITMHKQGISATNLPTLFYLFKRLPYKLIFRKAVKDSVKIITPSKSVKKELVENFNLNKDKVVQIYEGYDPTYLKAKTGKKFDYELKGDYFIYTGNAYPHKKVKRVIKAVSNLNEKFVKRASFVIVGSKDIFSKRIEKWVREENAGKFVRFLGFVSDEELVSLYQNSIGFIYPSLSEGFGLQGLEAMAAGTLVLASNIPTFKEVYKGNALYFNPNDFYSIEGAMKDALGMEKGKRIELIKKSQKFIKKYSWEKMAKQTLDIYNVLSDYPRPVRTQI